MGSKLKHDTKTSLKNVYELPSNKRLEWDTKEPLAVSYKMVLKSDKVGFHFTACSSI